jgi:hypothetical protein
MVYCMTETNLWPPKPEMWECPGYKGSAAALPHYSSAVWPAVVRRTSAVGHVGLAFMTALHAWIHKPSNQDATEHVPIDAKNDTGESTRPRDPFLTIDTLLLSSFLLSRIRRPPRFNKHTWHCPVFSPFSLFHSQGVAAAKNIA